MSAPWRAIAAVVRSSAVQLSSSFISSSVIASGNGIQLTMRGVAAAGGWVKVVFMGFESRYDRPRRRATWKVDTCPHLREHSASRTAIMANDWLTTNVFLSVLAT